MCEQFILLTKKKKLQSYEDARSRLYPRYNFKINKFPTSVHVALTTFWLQKIYNMKISSFKLILSQCCYHLQGNDSMRCDDDYVW